MTALSRRHFLVGAGAAALTLPFLRVLRASGDPIRPPKRLVIFYTPGGMVPDDWAPSGGETDFKLSPILAPLEPLRGDILVVGGLKMASADDDPNGHAHNQIAHALTSIRATGSFFQPGQVLPFVDSAGGVSVDQLIASQIGDTALPSLELAVQVRDPILGHARISYTGPHRPKDPEDDPYRAFAGVFPEFGKTPAELQRLHRRRQSVLDHVVGDLDRLHDRLGSAERPRLEAHLESMRELERTMVGPVPAACQSTPPAPGLDAAANDNYPAVMKMQIDLLVTALACGRTKVASLQCSNSDNQDVVATWLGINDGHHTLQHNWPKSTDTRSQLLALSRWFTEQFAYLVQQLKRVPDGDGTLLDNTAVFWANNLGDGSSHSSAPIPYVLAGRAGGYFRPGRYLKYGDMTVSGDHPVSHGRLLLSLCHAMDVKVDAFGDPRYCQGGPLRELT